MSVGFIGGIEETLGIAVELHKRVEYGFFELISPKTVSGASFGAIALAGRAHGVAIAVAFASRTRSDVSPVASVTRDESGEHVFRVTIAETLGVSLAALFE